jgi:hypothetical protein
MPFVKGTSGNPSGRPRGETARGALQRQVAQAMPAVIAKLVQLAVDGDVQAAKLLLDRLIAPVRAIDEPVKLQLPEDHAGRGEAIVEAVAAGRLTPSQAATLMQVLDVAQAIAERGELERRMASIELWMQKPAA